VSAVLIPADPLLKDFRGRRDLPLGEVTVRRADGALLIDHADPRVMVSLQLLDRMVCGDCPEVTVTLDRLGPSPGCWTGAVIRIEAANRTLVYRLTEYLDWYLGYIAEWPDLARMSVPWFTLALWPRPSL
jgi:hypothetical protein